MRQMRICHKQESVFPNCLPVIYAYTKNICTAVGSISLLSFTNICTLPILYVYYENIINTYQTRFERQIFEAIVIY